MAHKLVGFAAGTRQNRGSARLGRGRDPIQTNRADGGRNVLQNSTSDTNELRLLAFGADLVAYRIRLLVEPFASHHPGARRSRPTRR